jgi:hypothetical protein
MVDIQAAQDRGMLGQNLVEQIVKPTFTDVAQELVKEYAAIAADAKIGMTSKEFNRFRTSLIDSRTRMANAMTHQFREIRDQTIQYLER